MIKIFYGENRGEIEKAVKNFLGKDYEVLEGEKIDSMMLPSIFQGRSLFCEKRSILIKDFSENLEVFAKIADYLDTQFNVVIWETKLDKRTNLYKEIKDKIEIREFANAKKADFGLVFDIFKTAKRDGAAAVKMLEKIEAEQDPFQFTGLMISQALKDFNLRQGTKEKRVLKELSRLDMQLKTTSQQPWLLVKGFLLRLSRF